MGPYYVESIFTFDNTLIRLKIIDKERDQKKKLQKFGHIMSKFGVPYLPCSLVWTKISLDKYSSVYPTYLPKKFGQFGTKICQTKTTKLNLKDKVYQVYCLRCKELNIPNPIYSIKPTKLNLSNQFYKTHSRETKSTENKVMSNPSLR